MSTAAEHESFGQAFATACGADRVEMERLDKGLTLKLWRGETMCERTLTEREMDQPWEDVARAAKEALDG